MNDLEKIVPPLKLCRKIPVGKFDDSALVLIFWHKSPNTPVEIRTRCEVENDPEFDDLVEDQRIIIYPAPTLAEIMEAIDPSFDANITVTYHFGQWKVEHRHYPREGVWSDNDNPATAALRLWLKMEGIE